MRTTLAAGTLIVSGALFACLAVDGIAVSAKWSGSNANLYGGWGNIHRYTIQNDVVIESRIIFEGEARFATINQAGTHVAFIRKSGQISMVPIDGGTVADLAEVPSGKGYLGWPDGQWLYYSEGGYDEAGSKVIKKVNVDTRATASVITFNTTMWLWSVARDGDKASVRPCDGQDGSGTGHVYRYQLSQPGTIVKNNADDLGMGCGNAIAPSGSFIMRFDSYSHNSIVFHRWDKSTAARLTIAEMNGWGADMGSGWNRNRWSCNSDDWICTMQGWDGRNASEGGNQVLYDWRNNKQIAVTKDPNGSKIQNEAGCFRVGTVSATKVSAPSITPAGGSFDSTVQVTITCATAGAAVHYTADGNAPTASSTKYSAPFIVDLRKVSPVTVKARAFASGKTDSDIASMTYTVKASPALHSVSVTPSSAIINPGGTVQFAAKALDQGGAVLSGAPAASWSVSGGGLISASGLFTAGNTGGGPFTVTATVSSGGVSRLGTATVQVESTIVVTAPRGGEVYRVGDVLTVNWSGPSTVQAVIDISLDDGESWITLNDLDAIDRNDPRWNNFVWTIPATLSDGQANITTVSTKCRIKIWDYNYPERNDESDATFEIRSPASIRNRHASGASGRGAIERCGNRLRLLFPAPSSSRRISLYSIAGNRVIREEIVGGTDCYIDLSKCAVGSYVIEITGGEAGAQKVRLPVLP